jgi:RNA polymerase sigma factor (sigma-70 family)
LSSVDTGGTRDTREASQRIEAIWRIESPRLIAGLTRVVRDIGLAEDLAQDALVAALEQWPAEGIPDNPGAWLMTAAKRRGIDQLRRREMLNRKHQEIGYGLMAEQNAVPDPESALDDDIGDDLLKMMFTSCHPVLNAEARTALTLRLIGGLTTGEIARAFVVPEPTIAQRIVRAKKTIADRKIPFAVPRGQERDERLASVLEVIYLIFNEGYAATEGDDWMRPSLSEDALRLGRILAGLAPYESEVHGLVALMELQASRFAARVGPNGEPITLLEQNRARWDRLLITHGLAALERARALAEPRGPYLLQAEIAACHARAFAAEQTDWARIAELYSELTAITPSPIVDLNKAVAVSMAFGPAPALVLIDSLVADGRLRGYHLLPSVRADLLKRLGRTDEARAELGQAASLATNAREREMLLERARQLEPQA